MAVIEDEDDSRILAEAWIRRAELLEREGVSADCRDAYRRAAAHADPAFTPGIMIDLAAWCERSGDPAHALRIYEDVFSAADDPRLRAVALFRASRIFHGGGDHSRAVACLRAAMSCGEDHLELEIALALAEILVAPDARELGGSAERNEAEHLLQRVLESDHPDLAPAAGLLLARLRRFQGQPAEAERLCKLVIDSKHPGFADSAHALQSELIHEQLGLTSDAPLPSVEAVETLPSPASDTRWTSRVDEDLTGWFGDRHVVEKRDDWTSCFVSSKRIPSEPPSIRLPRADVWSVVILDREPGSQRAAPMMRLLDAVRRLLGDLPPPSSKGRTGNARHSEGRCLAGLSQGDVSPMAVKSQFLWTVTALIRAGERDFEFWLTPPSPWDFPGRTELLDDAEQPSPPFEGADEAWSHPAPLQAGFSSFFEAADAEPAKTISCDCEHLSALYCFRAAFADPATSLLIPAATQPLRRCAVDDPESDQSDPVCIEYDRRD